MHVRKARREEHLEVRRILDAAMLETGDVEARIGAGDVLVAVERRDDGDRHLGALVLESRDRGAHVAAVAVRRRRRGRGIGTALVEHALEQEGRLTARFDEGVRPFYDDLGFEFEAIDERRYRGWKDANGSGQTSES